MARMALHAPKLLPAPPAGLAVIRRRTGVSLGTLASWIGVTFLLGAAAFSLYLIQVSSVATAGYELQRLEAERKGWLARNEQLELELAKRRSLAWAELQAVQRLGMVRGSDSVYVVVPLPKPPPARVGEGAGVGSRRPEASAYAPEPASPEPRSPPTGDDAAALVDMARGWFRRLFGQGS